MTYGILFEKIEGGELPPGFYYAHVPALGLTTHGEGIEGARAAAADLVALWLSKKNFAIFENPNALQPSSEESFSRTGCHFVQGIHRRSARSDDAVFHALSAAYRDDRVWLCAG